MTKLLVSVRDAAEAARAVVAGADLVDVKEPSRGPLGAAEPSVLEAIVRTVEGRVPMSAALGELSEGHRLSAALQGRVAYAKFGLAGMAADGHWAERWQQAIERLPQGVRPVAVAYADWQAAIAPSPADVLAVGRSLGCAAALVDTFDKSAGPLRNHWTLADVARWIDAVRDAGLLCVVAGGLERAAIAEIVPWRPDYVGVRTAACRGGRTAALDADRVAALAALLRDWRTPRRQHVAFGDGRR